MGAITMKYQIIRDSNGTVVVVALLDDDSEGIGIEDAIPEIHNEIAWSAGDDPKLIEVDANGNRSEKLQP